MSSYNPINGPAVAGMTGAALSLELQTIQQQPEWRSSGEPKFFELVHRAEAIATEVEAR